MMKLMTKTIEEKCKKYPLHSQENNEDPLVFLKFFDPCARTKWYVIEAQKTEHGEWLFFGYVESPIDPLFDELGYFTLGQLENHKGILGIGVERDIHWTPRKLSEIKER